MNRTSQDAALALPPGAPGRIALGFMLVFPILYGLLSLWFGQDANWDLQNYHWYNGYALLNGRERLDVLVAQTPSFYNPALDVPFYLAATHLPARAVGFLLGALQGMNGVLLYCIAYAALVRPPMQRVLLSIAVAAIGMVGGGTLGEIGACFWDNIVSLGLFGGLLILVRYAIEPERKTAWAAVAGLLIGGAAALKQPHLLYAACIGLAVLTLPGSWTRRLSIAAWLAAGGVAGVLLTSGFWIWHLLDTYGNPLFPYFNNIFHSPYGDVTRDFRDTNFVPKSLWVKLFFPIHFTLNPMLVGEVQQRGAAVLALFVLLPMAIISRLTFGRRVSDFAHPAAARFLLTAIALSYLFWLQMFAIYRYLVPLEMLAPLGLVLALDMLPGGLRFKETALTAILVLCVATVVPADWSRVSWHRRMVEVEMPPIPSGAMALMAGYNPIGFVAPSLPPEVPVLRIQSNFMHEGSPPTRFTEILKERVAAHRGPFVLIYSAAERDRVNKAIGEYGLISDTDTCRPIPNSLEDDPILICAASRHAFASR